MDRSMHGCIKKWINLPKVIPIAYIHASCKLSGMGIPYLATTIQYLIYSRMESLKDSSSRIVRSVYLSDWVQKRISWAQGRLYLDGEYRVIEGATETYWRNKLYSSNDGADLKECFKTSVNNNWIDASSNGIPGRDYIQYHHVRINALPTKSGTSRRRRAEGSDRLCRAGCNEWLWVVEKLHPLDL